MEECPDGRPAGVEEEEYHAVIRVSRSMFEVEKEGRVEGRKRRRDLPRTIEGRRIKAIPSRMNERGG